MKKLMIMVGAIAAMEMLSFGADPAAISKVAFASKTEGTVAGTESAGYEITVKTNSLVQVKLTKNDAYNRDYSGWYAGVKITWNKAVWKSSDTNLKVTDNVGFSASTSGGLSSLGVNLTPAGCCVSNAIAKAKVYYYMSSSTWWMALTPQKIARLGGANYKATLVFSNGGNEIKFTMTIPTKGLNLGTESLANTQVKVTLSSKSFDYDTEQKDVSVKSVKCGAYWTLKEGTDYTVGGVTSARGSGFSDCTNTVEILPAPGSAFTSSKKANWTIKAPTRDLKSVTRSSSKVGGTLKKEPDGTGWRLKLGSGTDWVYYNKDSAPDGSGIEGWYAGFDVQLPSDTYQFTAPQYLKFSTDGDKTFFSGTSAAKLTAAGLVPGVADVMITKYNRTTNFLWWTRLTVADVKNAKAEGKDALVRTLSATGLRWESDETGISIAIKDPDGVREQVLTLEANLQGIVLYDDAGRQVYPADLPDPSEVKTDADVQQALADATPSLRAQITTVDEYKDFYAWVGSTKLDYQDVKTNENAFFSFATAQSGLVDVSAVTDDSLQLMQMVMEPVETAEGEVTMFTFAVSVDGVVVGSAAKSKYLMRVFGAAGAFSLESPESFSLANAALLAEDEDSAIVPFLWFGYVYFSVVPYDGQQEFAPGQFFVRPTVSPTGRTDRNPIVSLEE